jgi:molybdenum cofactor cytidylyltransferase
MGRPKLSLPLGERTVIEQTIDVLRSAGIDKVLVVIGPHVSELAPLAEQAGGTCLRLAHGTPDMRATVEAGLTWIEENWEPNDDDGFLLVPSDHPALDGEAIRSVTKAAEAPIRQLILIPTFNGKRGHPALIGWRHVPGIRALPSGLGLNLYLRMHAGQTREVPVASESILYDLDTPEDYERLQRLEASRKRERPEKRH